ncbi:angiotensinogen [Protobothrops mucrosquamatus]|uniref:angiotensinogen n=1 Tax=Protobothrops mucrosquamatus TaxID=103944 RepID=UPI000775FF3C|nr:angiotensinogen [Protobothrops mucrosquamatus]
MKLGVLLLCVLLYLTTGGCDRVYVHPFYLISPENTAANSCKELEEREQLVKVFVPLSIESHFTSIYEESLRNKSEEKEKHLGVTFLKYPIYVVGGRFYKELKKIHGGSNIVLSPIFIYESLWSIYLGASGQTATDLQILLGFYLPFNDSRCMFKIDGRKILFDLKIILNAPLRSRDPEGLFFSKFLCLFSAPGTHLSEPFVHELAFPDVNFHVRAVDFTNPTEATKQVNAFVEKKSRHNTKSLLADIDQETTLLMTTYTHFKAVINGASPLKEPQEFWLDSHTKIFVPMMTVSGIFKYKNHPGFSIVKIPLNKSVFLLLLQPNSELPSDEDLYSLIPSLEWLEDLQSKQIHLTFPRVSFTSIYSLQELLVKLGMSNLLGKEASFRLLSSSNVTNVKIINQQLFELSPSEDQVEAHTEEHAGETLKITLNKPFHFAVCEKESDVLIYFGQITNPLQET